MTRGNKHGGYTLVEVMIFLAISGLLLLIASLTINGKQAQADFVLGVGDFRAKLDDVINDVSTGYYPDVGTYSCQYGGGTPGNTIVFSGPSTTQGKHKDCVFLGKVLYFSSNPPNGTSNFSVITVAGGRLDVNKATVTTLADAKPVPVDSSSGPDLTGIASLDRGVVATRVYVNGTRQSAFGIFTSLPQSSASPVSGSLTSDIIAIPGSAPSDDIAQTDTNILSLRTNPLVTGPRVVICLRLGTSGGGSRARRAAIIIGARGRQITTEEHVGDVDSATVTSLTGGQLCPS